MKFDQIRHYGDRLNESIWAEVESHILESKGVKIILP
jgi:hypothetical protein